MEEEERSLESFLKWAAKLGISDSAPKNRQSSSSCLDQTLCVSHFPGNGGRGLAAARDLRQGDLILRVPKSALFTSQSRLKDEALSLAVNNHPSLSSPQVSFGKIDFFSFFRVLVCYQTIPQLFNRKIGGNQIYGFELVNYCLWNPCFKIVQFSHPFSFI